MSSFNNKLKQVLSGLEYRLKTDENFKKFFNAYNKNMNSDKLNPNYQQLSDKYKQQINAKIAEGNVNLLKDNYYPSTFRDSIDYELTQRRPFNSLTSDDYKNIYTDAENLAKRNYLDNFDSYNDAEDYYVNELIYQLTGKDVNRSNLNKDLSKLSSKQLEDYATSEYNLPELKSSNDLVDLNDDGIYGSIKSEMNKYPQDSDIYNSLEAELINQQLADKFNTNYINQTNEVDKLLATGNFNYPDKSVYTKTGNELIDALNEQNMMNISNPKRIRDFSDEDISYFNKNSKIFPAYEDDGLEPNRGINTYLDILYNMRK